MLRLRHLGTVAILVLGNCAPPLQIRGADLSSVRVGASQAEIETQLGVPPTARREQDRTVVAYRYGPSLVPAESLVCPPMSSGITGTLVFCPAMAAFFSATKEIREEALRTGRLLVVYGRSGVADWVVFGSTAGELQTAVSWIGLAECGDATAATSVAASLAAGTNGFPFDQQHALFWAAIASRRGSTAAEALRQKIQVHVSPDEAEAVMAKADTWQPAESCDAMQLPDQQ